MNSLLMVGARHELPILPSRPHFQHLARQALDIQLSKGLKAAASFWLDQMALWRGRQARALGGDRRAQATLDIMGVDHGDVTEMLRYAERRVRELTSEVN